MTIEGLDALAAWAGGDVVAAGTVREIEQRGDTAKRELLEALRAAFVTPLEPEDVFALSRSVDWILNHARDLVSESEALGVPPDDRIADMATLLGAAMRHVDDAIAQLESSPDAATRAADDAIAAIRGLDDTYYRSMAASLAVEDRTDRIARRELYRRCVAIGETVVDAAERVIYAVVKSS